MSGVQRFISQQEQARDAEQRLNEALMFTSPIWELRPKNDRVVRYGIEERRVAYARVVNLEYKSAEDIEIYFRKWEEWAPDNMPEAISRTKVRTGENSTLLMAIYKTEEMAERAREMADEFFKMEAQHLHEIIDFHGPVIE